MNRGLSDPPIERLTEIRQELLDKFMSDARRIRNRLIEIDEDIGIKSEINTNRFCLQCNLPREAHIYNVSKVHYIDGNSSNKLNSNKAIVCPCCEAHILLSARSPADMWELRKRGMSNAAIAREFGISRQRVGILLKRYKPSKPFIPTSEMDIEELIERAQEEERGEIRIDINKEAKEIHRVAIRNDTSSSKKRVTDRRTLRKKILKQMKKHGIKPK